MNPAPEHLLAFEEFLLDLDKRLLHRDGQPVKLERKEFDLLEYMAKNAGRDLTKEELKGAVWKDTRVTDGRLTQTATAVRAKLGGRFVESVWGTGGYKFNAVVEDRSRIPDAACPWVGLRPFDEGQATYFYGRDEEVARLVERLGAEKFMAIVGSSGRGKSSLARAGVIAALRRERADLKVKIIRPRHAPLRQLAIAVLELKGTTPTEQETEALVALLSSDPKTLARELAGLSSGRGPRTLLLIDQFEDIFLPNVGARERGNFISNILMALDPAAGVLFLLTVRTNFLQELEAYPDLLRVFADHHHWVRRFTRDDLRLAITRPAEAIGLEIDDGLVDLILNDLGDEHGALPLLSHTMAELFKHREGTRLTFRAYRAIGGVRGAIAHHAGSVFASLSHPEQEIARRLMLRLTDVGLRQASDVGRRVDLEELAPGQEESGEVRQVIKKLSDERLLTTGSEGETLSSGGRRRIWVELSHLSLIRHWPRLAGWLNEKRHALRVFHSLDADAREWEREVRDPGLLYRGHKLEQALEERDGYTEFVEGLHADFLRASEELKEQERQARARSHRRKRIVKLLAGTVAVLLLLASFFVWKWRDTKQERDVADSLRRAAYSTSQLSFDPELSLLLAIESGRLKLTEQTKEALRQALAASRVRAIYGGHEKQIISVALSPDGKYLLTGGYDPVALIQEVETGRIVREFGGHQQGVNWASYSPDGALVVTASRDGAARIWDVNTGRLLKELRRGEGAESMAINHAIFSPDGGSVVTGGEDGMVRLWDVKAGELTREFKAHSAHINTVAFSPDGRLIGTASGDRTAGVWDAMTGRPAGTLAGHQDSVEYISFSADGSKILTASKDKTARLWELNSWKQLTVLVGHALQVSCAEFSADGKLILTASMDGTARVWDARTGREILDLLGHGSAVNTAIFSPDGKYVFTASGDHTARKWEVESAPVARTLHAHAGGVSSASFSGNGTRIVTAGGDKTARVWDARSGQQLGAYPHPDTIERAAISADGALVATAGGDGVGRLWDVSSGQLKREFRGHNGKLHSIALSRDGTIAATGGSDGTARIWDAVTGEAGREIPVYKDKAAYRENTYNVYDVAFSPDSKFIATASKNSRVAVWDVKTGESTFEWNIETGPVNSVAFSLDGRYLLAACEDRTARVWDLTDKRAVAVLRGHDGRLNSAVFSPDGMLIVTASDDGSARLWEFGVGHTLFQLPDQEAGVKWASFSPDGKLLVAGNGSGDVIIYSCGICGAGGEELLKMAETLKTRELTAGERARFISLTR